MFSKLAIVSLLTSPVFGILSCGGGVFDTSSVCKDIHGKAYCNTGYVAINDKCKHCGKKGEVACNCAMGFQCCENSQKLYVNTADDNWKRGICTKRTTTHDCGGIPNPLQSARFELSAKPCGNVLSLSCNQGWEMQTDANKVRCIPCGKLGSKPCWIAGEPLCDHLAGLYVDTTEQSQSDWLCSKTPDCGGIPNQRRNAKYETRISPACSLANGQYCCNVGMEITSANQTLSRANNVPQCRNTETAIAKLRAPKPTQTLQCKQVTIKNWLTYNI